MKRVDYGVILDLFCYGMAKLAVPTLSNLVGGYEEYASEPRREELLARLQREGLLARTGRGVNAVFTVTAKGWERFPLDDPRTAWDRPWDGAWRVFAFDLPERRRRDRKRLWQALRSRKLGLLQRSVWVWPHDLRAIMDDIVRVDDAPECFCGFTARDLFLSTDPAIVAGAWDWEEITRRQHTYLEHLVARESTIRTARSLGALATLARVDRQAYRFAFSLDPLLPRSLQPKTYFGEAVHRRHQELRERISRRLRQLTPTL